MSFIGKNRTFRAKQWIFTHESLKHLLMYSQVGCSYNINTELIGIFRHSGIRLMPLFDLNFISQGATRRNADLGRWIFFSKIL